MFWSWPVSEFNDRSSYTQSLKGSQPKFGLETVWIFVCFYFCELSRKSGVASTSYVLRERFGAAERAAKTPHRQCINPGTPGDNRCSLYVPASLCNKLNTISSSDALVMSSMTCFTDGGSGRAIKGVVLLFFDICLSANWPETADCYMITWFPFSFSGDKKNYWSIIFFICAIISTKCS